MEHAEADRLTTHQAAWARRFQEGWAKALEALDSGKSAREAAAAVFAASVAAQGRADWAPDDPNARDGEPARAFAKVAKVLRAHRTHRGWSHQQLAEESGIEKIRIKNFEQATEAPTANELAAIGRVFGVRGLHWEVGPTADDIRCVLDARVEPPSSNNEFAATEETKWVALLRTLTADDRARLLDLARRLGRVE